MSGTGLFTTWMTSMDGVDHAVTDEEFTARRPEPAAVCGVVILLAPMEWEPGPHCPRCVAYLAAQATLLSFEQRLGVRRHRRGGWLGRLLHATLSPVVPSPRARHDRPQPPADQPRQVPAGPDSSAVAWPPQAAAEETHTWSGAVTTPTGARPAAAQPATPSPAGVPLGLGGPQTTTPTGDPVTRS